MPVAGLSPRSWGEFRLTALLVVAVAFGLGCRTPGGAPPDSAFAPPPRVAAAPPNAADRTAADLARAALLSRSDETERALHRMEAIERVLAARESRPTGLVPVSMDLRNTTLDDRRAYRGASRRLLGRKDLDPALRARLELFRDDDPLELAGERIQDDWHVEFARAFNTVAEPLGRSILATQMAPYRLGRSLVDYAVYVYTREALSLQRRQALAHWKEFLARNPESPEAESIAPLVRGAEARWRRTQRDRAVRRAKHALDNDKVRLALVYADRALGYQPEDREASDLRDEAGARLTALREQQSRSVRAAAENTLGPDQRELALALLLPGRDLAGAAERLREAEPEGRLADEARFARALARGEAGDERAMWRQLEDLAEEDDRRSNMARHATALVNDPELHSYRAFREAVRRDRWDRFRWVWLGPLFMNGFPERGLPGPLEWILDAPSLVESIAATPTRLIHVPWARALPTARTAAALARRHLAREPHGERSETVRDWLEGYESGREHWIGALQVAEGRDEPDLSHLAELREKASQQYLEMATRERSLGLRMGMYQHLGGIYPGTGAARVAGELARMEAEEATEQHIRITRRFLIENPEVAGRRGLALRPELLDGDGRNAELHPEGVTLIGARSVRISYLDSSGDEDDEPRREVERLGSEHLARVVSQLEETSYRKMLLDPLESVEPDARRDLYFERVRLGLAEQPDERLTASSGYTYLGLRERYGMVRAREGILPFDLVVQGSLSSLSFGAFPRMRRPRETPDAILYR